MMKSYFESQCTRRIRTLVFTALGSLCLASAFLAGTDPAGAATWRVGDQGQPWRLRPVSYTMDLGESYKPDYDWGGSHAMEVVVDDDGDGLVDEDPVNLVDDDSDGLYNEDPANGIDDDRDGLLDEDGPDPQIDDDGDGLLNEDGRRTGGLIYDLSLREAFKNSPFFRYATPEEAAADPKGAGYGWGDDDLDGSFNEDPLDGKDNDEDGLVDEDGPGTGAGVPASWRLPVFAYDAGSMTVTERKSLRFAWDPAQGAYVAPRAVGNTVVARLEQRQFFPTDWMRPIRLDPLRNVMRIVEDYFLAGVYSNTDPFDSNGYGSNLSGSVQFGEAGHGQEVDGNVFTARIVSNRSSAAGLRAELRGLYTIDMLRLRPRPDFPDRTPTSFQIRYAGDKPNHFQTRLSVGELKTRLVLSDFIIPLQTDQTRPAIKEYLFDGGELGDPRRVRVMDMRSLMPEGQTWELAEFEAYGHGYALDASYVTEIIDVGTPAPRYRRYADEQDPTRAIAFESVLTVDANRNGKIDPEEQSSAKLAKQFDQNASGIPVTWGRARWKGRKEGKDADVQVRVRSGSSLDTRIYTRKVGRGVYSTFIDKPIVLDWPVRGSQVDAFSYIALSGLERPTLRELVYNTPTDRDGIKGGWTFWSSPFTFEDGLVDENGKGGILLPLPPLTRYIQFRFDFETTEDSGISLDYIEFDFSPPVVSRGVVAEIFPDTTGRLGQISSFYYVLKPDIATADVGFNRIDILVPSLESRIDSFLVDDLAWTRLAPDGPGTASKAWLDTVQVTADRTFATATYLEPATGLIKMGIKTRVFRAADFPRGQDKEIEIHLQAPVFKLLTQFDSWVWNDQGSAQLQQPTSPGNAADRLPSDDVKVTVEDVQKTLDLRTIGPNPFTPNGDGINDQAVFDFDLFLLTIQAKIEVTIFDMAGRPVRKLGPLFSRAGEQRLAWDGRDEANELMPPGLYLYQLSVDSDSAENKTITGTLGVAY